MQAAAIVPQTEQAIMNAFTVDVEDYFQVQAFADVIDRKQWDEFPSRVVANTHAVLRLLDAAQVQGTFFILGWVAERFPQLVRDIHKSGHEIGSHSYWHRLIYEMTPDEFREDLRQSRDVLTSITGEPVVAFRAPCFSITLESLWALDVLASEGFRYDSSIFPIIHDNYGIPNAERFPHCVECPSGSLWEFPPSVVRLWKYNLPVAGGGYFRFYPALLSLACLGRVNRIAREPFMFYIHPWEVDPDQPRLPASLTSRFRHYQNLRTTTGKLQRLLKTFRFGSLQSALSEQQAANDSRTAGAISRRVRLADIPTCTSP